MPHPTAHYSSVSYKFIAGVVEEANDLIAALDRHHRFVVCNRAYREAFLNHFQVELQPGASLADVLAHVPIKQRRAVVACEQALAGNETTVVARLGPRTYEIAHRPLRDDDGQIFGAMQIAHDVTDRTASEEALRRADKRKSDFLSLIAHELRNPLASVRFALDVIERHNPVGAAARAVDAIERQLHQLTRLVDDLLDMGRITRGKLALQIEIVDLRVIVRMAVDAVSPYITRARQNVDISTPDDPIWLQADPARIEQVLTNLLHNASKFTGEGGHISVTAAREGDRAALRVCDDGIGFDPESASALFGMFSQGRAHEAHGGLGIGLSLVKQLVEMHHGSVEAHSEGMGRGAEFVVRLPRADREG